MSKAKPTHKRRKAREFLLNTLFQQDFRLVDIDALLAEENIKDEFIAQVLKGVQTHREALDEVIRAHAKGWTLDRLVSVDRNILRLSLYELLHTDTPPEVIINEAVELAKRFGTENSSSFINGVLDTIWKELHPTEA